VPGRSTTLSIESALDGQRIAITGGTGFLGTALIERLLRSAPGCELVLLIRPSQRRTVAQRARREIFKNDAFDVLRAQLDGGGEDFDAMVDRRVTVIAGDVGSDGLRLDDEGRAVLATCDTVIHSAATVSFDSPLDSAVEVNLLGPSRIAAVLHEICDPADLPHLVAVSTCYVAGNRKGSAPEEPVDANAWWIGADWRDEVAAARRARTDAEAESRRPEMLARFRKEARRELGAAGTPLLAAKTEQRRSAWVSDQLVEAGRSRAASLGWPDAYAYTKAFGEKALFEQRGDLPVSVVRPAIIESSLAEPSPGWIRGFRMAEPVIISYARGLLKEFPGVPEGIIDVIPVDLVCGAICAVAADGPARNDDGTLAPPRIVQSASGSANPLRYRRLVDNVRSWFTEHPVYDSDGQPIVVPEWSFPGRAACRPSSSGPKPPSSGPRARCRPSRCGAARPSGRPRSSPSARTPSAPSPTSSSTAPTPSARPCTASSTCSGCGSAWTTPAATPSASTPASSTGTATSTRSTCPRWSSTPG
jgi:alcohol-forming fatty acyl-CoA reductase